MISNTLRVGFFLLIVVQLINAYSDICYDGLGCFTDRPPFSGSLQRPIAVLPETPEKISTQFILRTRRTTSEVLINYRDLTGEFNPNAKTVFIIHGFLHYGRAKLVVDLANAILEVEDINVVAVDYSKGNGFPYTQAVANAQVVGAEIARLINAMIAKGSTFDHFHLIGHSLGTHVAGYAGQRLEGKIARITGLDPAGPYFENTPAIVRLDPTDAQFVDCVHTDGAPIIAAGLGTMQPMGHADFYVNGGNTQPGCPSTTSAILSVLGNLVTLDIDGFENESLCNHVAAFKVYIDSIKNRNSCQFYSYSCNSYEEYLGGKCVQCKSPNGCNLMGYFASPNKDQGKLYLSTQDASGATGSFCKHGFKIELNSDKTSGMLQTRAYLTAQFQDAQGGATSAIILDESNETLKPNSVLTRYVEINKRLAGEAQKISLSFKKGGNLISGWLYDDQWSFSSIKVFDAETQRETWYCTTKAIIKSGEIVDFNKC